MLRLEVNVALEDPCASHERGERVDLQRPRHQAQKDGPANGGCVVVLPIVKHASGTQV